jgi:hypothetical protein
VRPASDISGINGASGENLQKGCGREGSVSCAVHGAREVKATPDQTRNARSSTDAGGKPALLMLSHCVPQSEEAGGEPERARAWALLRLVSQSHRVYLVSLYDGPVRLEHWRALREHAYRVTLESPGIVRRLLGRTIGLFDRRTGRSLRMKRDLTGPVTAWAGEMAFDAVLSTHASLWRYAEAAKARVMLCDAMARPLDSRTPVIVLPMTGEIAVDRVRIPQTLAA